MADSTTVTHYCGRKVKTCPKCKHRYTKDEKPLTACPECHAERACRAKVSRAGQACRVHGGASPKGIASPHYKGAGKSKYLPARMLADYQEAADDQDLIALHADIALVEARIADILKRVDSGESGAQWANARAAYDALLVSLRATPADPQEQAQRIDALGKTLARGRSDYAAWNELARLIEQKRKLIETEQKRLIAARDYVTVAQEYLLFDALVAAVTRNVVDRETLTRIQNEWSGVFDRPR